MHQEWKNENTRVIQQQLIEDREIQRESAFSFSRHQLSFKPQKYSSVK
jgi:hypothetical protein